MNFTPARYPLIIGVILSILLHWIGLNLSAPDQPAPTKEPQPFYVDVLPTQPQRETILPQQPETSPPTTQRQGAVDQHVEKEQAPQASDMEDSSPSVAPPQPPQPKGEKPEELPTLKDLFQTGVNAAADIARSKQTKQRPNIENGDKLLLNMEQDKLFSFFNRFKKGIYGVWNYPEESIKKKQQGISLLKITINKDGTIDDVDLVTGSGFERLDREAIAAIFKGQPYGTLPDSYEEDQLIIHAYFEYILGQRQPNIYRQ
jgi:protein TonB